MANNTMKKVLAVVLIGSMAASLAACGKPSAKKLSDVAEKKFKAEQIELEDIEDLDQDEIMDSLEDGIYIHTSGEEIYDEYEHEIDDALEEIEDTVDALDKSGMDLEELYGFDITEWDTDDIGDMTVYAMADGLDKPEKDLITQGALVIEFTDKAKANDAFYNAGQLFLEQSEIDTKGLNKNEFICKKSKFQFIVNGDADLAMDLVEDLSKMIIDKYGDGEISYTSEDIKEMREELEEYIPKNIQFVIAVYYNSGTLTVIFGVSMDDDLDQVSEIAKALGVPDPTKVVMSDEMYEGFLTYIENSLDDLDEDLLSNVRF